MLSPHLHLLIWQHQTSEESGVHLCRECESLLWRRHSSCPSCRAVSPSAASGSVLARPMPRLDRLAVTLGTPAPLLAVDQLLHRLLTAP